MTRTEELTVKLIEGVITTQQLTELEWAIASDPAAARQHVGLMELEAALRGRNASVDVSAAVMARLRQGAATESDAETGDELASVADAFRQAHGPDADAEDVFGPAPPSEPAPTPRRRVRRRRKTPVGLYLAFGLAVVLVIAAYFVRRELTTAPPRPINQARVTELTGSASIVRDGTTYRAEVGSPLGPGDRIETAANSIVTMRYDPSHEVRLRSDAEASFAGTGPAAPRQFRQMELRRGVLEMTALAGSGFPAVELLTPHARVNAEAARYTAEVARGRTTVTVDRGMGDVRRRADEQTVRAQADQRVVVEAGLPLLAVPTDSGGRVRDGLVVFYPFIEDGGTRVTDQSGIDPSVDLTIADPTAVTWGKRLLRIHQPTTILTQSSNTDLIAKLRAGDGLTIETWLTPADAEQHGPAAIVSLGSDIAARNFTLAQGAAEGEGSRYNARIRTSRTGGDAEPAFLTPPGAAQAELTHLVFTRAGDGTVKFYIDGELRNQDQRTGDDSNWATDAPFGLANEATGNRPWLGELRLVAIYNRPLTEQEIQRNHAANLVYELTRPSKTEPAAPERTAKWEEATYLVLTGSDRSTPFTITGSAFRLNIKFTQPDDLAEPLVVRLRDYRDASRSQNLLERSEHRGVTEATAKFGPGEYIIEVLGPDMTDWRIQVEQQTE